MKFDGDLIITDPCYIAKDCDWGHGFDYVESKISDEFDFSSYLWIPTGIGDCVGYVKQHKSILNQLDLEEFIFNLLNLTDSRGYIKLNEEGEDIISQYTNIGKFGVDSGTYGVFYLPEVMRYSPKLLTDYHSGCYSIIRDFVGDIEVWTDEDTGQNYFLGVGNKTIFTL